ncbi:MAG: MCE family protein, partial [Actinomycetes bacterium]
MTARRLRAVAAALLMTGTLTACEGVYDLPLPGGAAGGDDVYRVTVEFADVLDLVPQSAVKVNDVTVGAVEEVRLDGWHAEVDVRLLDSVRLPDNAAAELRQTSLLGEKFVSLGPPPGGEGVGRLKDGDTIPLSRSGRNPEVEEVFAALSLVLNGGGVAQLKTINVELTKAMKGHEADIQGALRQLDTFIGGLDEHKGEIVRALDGLDRLSARLEAQKEDIGVAIEDLGPGLKVLADQRAQLTKMLTALSDLGRVGTRVINTSKADTVANLRALDPILT